MTSLRERVRAGATTRGTFLNLGSVLSAELCALAGFDWLLVDLEHGAGGEGELVTQVLAGAAHDVPVLARVESSEAPRTSRVLDAGVAGVMIPRVTSRDDALAALSHLWYPPRGTRGVARYVRARQFGHDRRDETALNGDVLAIVQIETAGALEQVDAIAALEGLDVLFVGPADLSLALGVPGQLDAPRFDEALEAVVTAAKNHGVTAGVLAPDVARATWYEARGFRFIAVASDAALLLHAAREAAGTHDETAR